MMVIVKKVCKNNQFVVESKASMLRVDPYILERIKFVSGNPQGRVRSDCDLSSLFLEIQPKLLFSKVIQKELLMGKSSS